MDLKVKMRELIEHLSEEHIIEAVNLDALENKTFHEEVQMLRRILQETYPDTKLKREILKSVHYANGFPDELLKQSAFVLDEIEQYLTRNKFMNHDEAVTYFNDRITSQGFVINPNSWVGVMVESLSLSKRA